MRMTRSPLRVAERLSTVIGRRSEGGCGTPGAAQPAASASTQQQTASRMGFFFIGTVQRNRKRQPSAPEISSRKIASHRTGGSFLLPLYNSGDAALK